MKKVLITGGAGFIGCNLADRLAGEGREVIIFDALTRQGVEKNLAWLESRHGPNIISVFGDTRDAAAVKEVVREAEVIFHLAAQVAVTTSLAAPRDDFEVNVGGTLNVLEAARLRRTPVIFASTNKVYGDLADIPLDVAGDAYSPRDPAVRSKGIGEGRSLSFHTPYGCSKGAADQYVLDYARSYDLPTCVFRMSCIYGPRQLGTEDQGWVAHFLIRALEGKPICIFGDGRQVRDLLCVADAVEAYLAAWQWIEQVRGQAFNLGGGPANAVSLIQLVAYIEALLGRQVEVTYADWRAGDQRYYVSNPSRARHELRLGKPRSWRTGVAALADWLTSESGGRAAFHSNLEATPCLPR